MSASLEKRFPSRVWESPFYRAFLLAKHKSNGKGEEIAKWEEMLTKADRFASLAKRRR